MNAFDRIIGYTAEKRELKILADNLKNRAFYEKLGVSAPRGLLLHGEPGVGKTLMANALIDESGRRVFLCRKDQAGSDFIGTLRTVFDEAAKSGRRHSLSDTAFAVCSPLWYGISLLCQRTIP